MRHLKLAIVAISFGVAGIAFAQGGPPGGGPPNPAMVAMRAACQADMDKVCAGKQGPDVRACMEANASKLSKECNDARAKMAAAMPAGGPPPR